MCFIGSKLIRKNLFSLSEKVLKLTYSNVEIKIFSWGNTLDPRFRGGGRGERGKRGVGEERKGRLELSERRGKGREKEGKGGGKVQLGEEPPPAVCEFLDSPLYTLQYSA